MTEVSVILPTFNECETIESTLDGLTAVLDDEELTGEILVVDDDSPDRTWQLARAHDDARVRVIRRQRETRGLSSAVLCGFEDASSRYVVVMDADGQHDPTYLPALLSTLSQRGTGVVVGSRYIDGGGIENWNVSRMAISGVATSLAGVLAPSAWRTTDPMSGFFGIDTAAVDIDKLCEDCDPHGYKILLEVLSNIDKSVGVADVPITFYDRQDGKSKLTLDEQLRFFEQALGLAIGERNLDQWVVAPQLIRSLELGAITGASICVLYFGLIIGGVTGAAGAGLIAMAGGMFVLGLMRYWNTGEQWATEVIK
jgi:dolichol-phosphate mannosyltransferase